MVYGEDLFRDVSHKFVKTFFGITIKLYYLEKPKLQKGFFEKSKLETVQSLFIPEYLTLPRTTVRRIRN